MRLLSYETQDDIRVAACLDDLFVDVNRAAAAMFYRAGNARADALAEAHVPPDMMDLLAGGQESLDMAKKALGFVKRLANKHTDELLDDGILLEVVQPIAPVPTPGKILCLGLNYRDHAEESGIELPAEPVVFSKLSTAVIGPGEPIVLAKATKKADYEVELAVVIGKHCKDVKPEAAMDCVAGYTIINDVSARDYQLEKPGGQWLLGKSFDTFCPMGPWIVTPDELRNPHALDIKLELNGKLMQRSNTKNLIFDVPAIIAYLSKVATLEPGDVIATGTPGGVGFARKPPVFLKPDDACRLEISKIGVLENSVVAE